MVDYFELVVFFGEPIVLLEGLNKILIKLFVFSEELQVLGEVDFCCSRDGGVLGNDELWNFGGSEDLNHLG